MLTPFFNHGFLTLFVYQISTTITDLQFLYPCLNLICVQTGILYWKPRVHIQEYEFIKFLHMQKCITLQKRVYITNITSLILQIH